MDFRFMLTSLPIYFFVCFETSTFLTLVSKHCTLEISEEESADLQRIEAILRGAYFDGMCFVEAFSDLGLSSISLHF